MEKLVEKDSVMSAVCRGLSLRCTFVLDEFSRFESCACEALQATRDSSFKPLAMPSTCRCLEVIMQGVEFSLFHVCHMEEQILRAMGSGFMATSC